MRLAVINGWMDRRKINKDSISCIAFIIHGGYTEKVSNFLKRPKPSPNYHLNLKTRERC